jgi:alpha-ketoglutarate-dependent taurine dioxygenase
MRLPPMHRQLLGRRVSSWCQRGLATVSTDLPRATPLGPVNGTFGAEVTGVDLTKPLAPPVIKELVNLQNKYGVLAFRSTGLEDDTHVRYSKSFGALESIHGVNKPRRASSPHLYDAGNLDEEGNIIPKHSRAWWHSKGNGKMFITFPIMGVG